MTKVSSQTVSFTDTLREEQQEGFPLLSEVTKGFVEDPLALMRTMDDEDGITVPCALPDSMWQSLPKMIRDVLALYEDPDIRTMLLAAMMPTLGSAMSNVRVRHERKLYSLGMMHICVGPSASGKGAVGDVASLVSDINEIVRAESAQEMDDYRKRLKRYARLCKQREGEARRDTSQLIDINDIAEEVDEPQPPLRRTHSLPAKTTAANYYKLLYANGPYISYLFVPELAELNAADRTAFGDFKYMMLAAQNEEPLHTARKTDDEDYRIERTRLAFVATGTMSAVQVFIPNLEDGLSTRFLYHNLPGKSTMRDEMDEATAEAMNIVYGNQRERLTALWDALRVYDGKPEEELPRLMLSNEQREYINKFYSQLLSFITIISPENGLRAPIVRSRLNLYRMLMIIALLRRYDGAVTAEEVVADTVITIDDDDLRWGLTYIFYLTMQTSSLYSRLRPEEKKERKQGARISPLFLLQMLPNQFTTAEAEKIGKELGISPRTTSKHLNTLVSNDNLKRPYNGHYVKVAKKNKKTKPAA
jgi:hypothetical protein